MKKIFVLTKLVLENNNLKGIYAQAIAVAYDFERIMELVKEEFKEIIEEHFEDDINKGLVIEDILDKIDNDEYDNVSFYLHQYGNSSVIELNLKEVTYKLSVDKLKLE